MVYSGRKKQLIWDSNDPTMKPKSDKLVSPLAQNLSPLHLHNIRTNRFAASSSNRSTSAQSSSSNKQTTRPITAF
eukprot:CAMPEP_0201558874 /NCGR_PEP_ID=MMETSP0173_2-20130828/70507_1 /ASSEMBLY_ACC=CAM_ASM_000268 /TAXON_ID=218659 /ORGANISM="Vexillifera sp., Strain DIVA3 564/2" /LENGTH=74 /DNA_ID=CAMNT_0047972521 /DNA_START=96 /DNA_END=317 /DNA_ORIENTATION=-